MAYTNRARGTGSGFHDSMEVYKKNSLIQEARYSLPIIEQKLILRMIAMVDPSTIDLTDLSPRQRTLTFNITDFAQMCGSTTTGGKTYEALRASLLSLVNSAFLMRIPGGGGKEITFRWVNKALFVPQKQNDADIVDPEYLYRKEKDGRYVLDKQYGEYQLTKNGKYRKLRKSGYVQVELSDDLLPYISDMSRDYYHFNVIYTLSMKSTYSIHIYEWLKSQAWNVLSKEPADEYIEVGVEELKFLLSPSAKPTEKTSARSEKTVAEKYKNWADFKRFVLDGAVKEINDCSDLKVRYEPIKSGKNGKKFDILHFYVEEKADGEIRKVLDKKEDIGKYARRGASSMLMEEITPAPVMPYVSAPDKPLDHESIDGPAAMKEELRMRALYPKTSSALEPEQCKILDRCISTLVKMAYEENEYDEMRNGINLNVLDLLNEIIERDNSLQDFLLAEVEKLYTRMHAPGQKIISFGPYCRQILINDLQFSAVLVEAYRGKHKKAPVDAFNRDWDVVFDDEYEEEIIPK